MSQSRNPLYDILSRLSSVKHTGKHTGNEYSAQCPAHDDQHNSLSVSEGKDGRALIKCHAGCSAEDVVSAMGLTMKDLFPHFTHDIPKATKQTASQLGRIRDTYDYQDSEGTLLFQAVRYEPKDFRQRRPDGHDGWIYNLQGVQTVLYRLPQLQASAAAQANRERAVFVVEGEKDADRLADLGLIATTCPMGAGKWREHYTPMLAGRHVVILPDNDKPGRNHAHVVARAIMGVAASVRILELPGLLDKGDVSDWLQMGGTLDELQRLAEARPLFTREGEAQDVGEGPDNKTEDVPGTADGADGKSGRKLSQATRLVSLADSLGVTLFHTLELEGYATFEVGGHTETWPLKSKGFRRWLARAYYNQEHTAPGSQAIQDTIGVLEGRAIYEAEQHPVYVRLARHEDAIYLDLANERWQVVKITQAGWTVEDKAGVKFRRPRGMLAWPRPSAGHVNMLRPFINVSDKDWALIAGFLVACLRPEGPYPLLGLIGEPGSAKSTTARLLRALIDPSVTPLRAEPRNEHELVIAASNSWLPTFDNISHIPSWLANALCRLATGGGFSARELYTDDEETLFEVMRPAMTTSITDVATYPDLLDRYLLIGLKSIPEDKRQSEDGLYASFEAARPCILGGLLDAVVCAMRNLPTVRLDRMPRMADFAKWATAAEGALGLPQGGFMQAFSDNRSEADSLSLESEPIADRLLTFMEDKQDWRGSASELLTELNEGLSEEALRAKEWPKRADKLSGRLRRIAPNLRRLGLDVDTDSRSPDRKRGRQITIRTDMQSSVRSVRSVQQAQVASEVATARHKVASDNEQVASALYAQSDATDATDATLQPYSKSSNGNGRGPGIAHTEDEALIWIDF